LKFGVRAHDFGRKSPAILAKEISDMGFEAAQLALSKALLGIDENTYIFENGLPEAVKSAFNDANVEISVLGCYINLVHPDEKIRDFVLTRFENHIKFASMCGAKMVGTETGSLNANFSFNPENHSESAYLQTAKSVARLVECGERLNVNVGIEGVSSYTINTPKKLKRLIDDIKSDKLKIILDPVNLLTYNNYEKQEDIIKESVELFGDKIDVLHAKDFVASDDKLDLVTIGTGMLNYKLIFELLRNKEYSILFEGASIDTMKQSLSILKSI